MATEVIVTAFYPKDPDEVFAEAIQFSEMQEAMHGLATYDGLPDDILREGETYVVDVTFLGFLKNKGHTMFLERLDIPNRLVQSRETNPPVIRWDHILTVSPDPQGSVWVDRIIIEAGWQTGLMARFARYMYTRRHKHRSALSITRSLAALPD
jgi:hypothetical protein